MHRVSTALPMFLLSSALATTPAGSVVHNQASFLTGNSQTLSNNVNLSVQAVCGLALSPALQQQTGKPRQTSTFTYTLSNTGNSSFTFKTWADPLAGTQQIVTPTSLTLAPAATAPITLQLTPSTWGQFTATIHAACQDDTAQSTAKALLDAHKPPEPLTVTKSVNAERAAPGDIIVYTLVVTNPNDTDVPDVTLTDTLQSGLTIVDAGDLKVHGQTLSTHIDRFPALTTVQYPIRVKLSELDDQEILNTAQIASSVQPPTPSNSVNTVVYAPKLAIQKSTPARTVPIGDVLPFTITVTNSSLNASVNRVSIHDSLPSGLELLPESLQLDGLPVPDSDPDPQIIQVTGGDLSAGKSAVLTYRTRVTPLATSNPTLRNVAFATAISSRNATDTVLRTAEVDSLVILNTPQDATLIGRVYLDRNADGSYTAGQDDPVSGARLLVSGIGTVLTDSEGRYGITHLRQGTYAVSLDRQSLTGFAQRLPGGYGLEGIRKVTVSNLTTADFALAAPSAQTSTTQQLHLQLGPLSVTKTLSASGAVTTTFTSSEALTLTWQDPLPADAQLRDGQNAATLTLLPGIPQTLSYRFTSPPGTPPILTDPVIRSGGQP